MPMSKSLKNVTEMLDQVNTEWETFVEKLIKNINKILN